MTGVHNKLRGKASLVIIQSETVTCWNMTLTAPDRAASIERTLGSPACSLSLSARTPMLLLLIRPMYCLIKWITTSENYCGERQARNLMAAASAATAGITTGIRAMLRKLFMSTTSSAVGTWTVLGIHSALAPSEPAFQGSDLRDAWVDESRN